MGAYELLRKSIVSKSNNRNERYGKYRGCARRRMITDVVAGLYRAAIRRLPITKQSAARASTQVVGSGTAAETAESEATMP